MTPYAREIAMCRIVWLEDGERKQTPPFEPYDLEDRLEMIRMFGKPLYLIRCLQTRPRRTGRKRPRRVN